MLLPLPAGALLLSILTVCLPGVLASAGPARALGDTGSESAHEDGLSGRDIYDRLLANRFEASEQTVRLVSGDRGGNEQESRMTVLWKSFRDETGAPRRGVLSKTRILYTHPFDLRFSGYLIVHNRDRADDQFVYLASRRRVRRVRLRGEAVMGTDFSFEDVVPREVEDADYRRLADETWDGRECYVVEITPRPESESEYSRFVSRIDRERMVVLHTRYWSSAGVEVKELKAPAAEVERIDGIWVPMRAEMRHLLTGGYTILHVETMTGNPPMPDAEFDPRRLESH
ncbi:outer membrane lipoprotein-sorting protein [Myxococcota bacterium]|nr:outer membrane lipoprotein-sorting protein [Myxococcota bacterium]MCZ7620550.1 outer membrane lipoprotein-sorting protein [Myxococcota bacterium]